MIARIGASKPLQYNLDMGFIIVPADQKRVEVKILDYPDEVGSRALSPSRQRAHRELAADPQREHEGAAAARADPRAVPARGRGRPPRHPRRSGQREVPRVLAGEAHRRGLAGFERGHLEPAHRARCGPSAGPRRTRPAFPSSRRSSATTSARGAWSSTPCASRCARRAVPTSCPPPTGRARATDPDLPRMGERFRLRKDFDVSGFPPHVQAILKGLKTYGMFVADNGSDWWMSIAPDRRLAGPGDAPSGEGLRLRGGGHGRPVGRGRLRPRHEALHGGLRRACLELARARAGQVRGRASGGGSSRRAATWTAARAERYAARFGFARAYVDVAAMLDGGERPMRSSLVVPETHTVDARPGAMLGARAARSPREAARAARVAEVDRLIAAAAAEAAAAPGAASGRLQPALRAPRP